MLQKMGHFNSRLAFKMGPRRKCQISQDFYRNFGEILHNRPFVSENDPFRQLIAARNWPNFETNRARRRRPGTLREMRHFNSLLAFKMGYRQKCQISHDISKMSGDPGRLICLEKWPLSISNHGSKLAKFRDKSAPQEEAGDVAENAPF